MKKRFNAYNISNENKKLLEKDPKMPLVDKIIYDTLEKRVLIQVPIVDKGFIDVYSPRYGMYSIRGRGNTLEQAVEDYYLNEKELLNSLK